MIEPRQAYMMGKGVARAEAALAEATGCYCEVESCSLQTAIAGFTLYLKGPDERMWKVGQIMCQWSLQKHSRWIVIEDEGFMVEMVRDRANLPDEIPC